MNKANGFKVELDCIKRFLLRFVGILSIFISFSSSAFAKQCFGDVQAAYAYMQQQNLTENIAMQSGLININTASEAELTRLNGVGSKKAQAIILYREGFGDFANIDELARVKGIGVKTVEKNRAQLTIN